ncbi:MAG: hypothetical protein QM791_00595 [Ferruginibacter sp.]
MTTNTFLPSIAGKYAEPVQAVSFFKRFINWCASKEEKRFLWQGVTLTVHGCILTPIAMLAALLAGVDSYLYIPVIAAIAITFITNLAALPTKITIPVFFLSVLIDLGVIAAAAITGMNFSSLF